MWEFFKLSSFVKLKENLTRQITVLSMGKKRDMQPTVDLMGDGLGKTEPLPVVA